MLVHFITHITQFTSFISSYIKFHRIYYSFHYSFHIVYQLSYFYIKKLMNKERLPMQTEHVYIFNETSINNEDEQHTKLIYRDKNIINRFWFQFPSELRTSERNENIIGLRSCIISNGDRHCRFTLDIRKTELTTKKVTEISVGIGCHIARVDRYDNLIQDIRWYVSRAREQYEEEWKEQGIPIINEYNIGYKFENEPNTGIMSFVIEGRDQLNTYGTVNDNDLTDVPEVLYETELRIRNLDDDGKKLLLLLIDDLPDEYNKKIYFPGVWDRNPVILKSNLAMNSIGNYIGYTNNLYSPIKYYKLTSNDPYFWIEMYNGTDHISPAIIPMDGKDSFILEIVIV